MIRYEEIEPHLIDYLHGSVEEAVEYRIKAYLQQNPDFQQELDELEETLEFSQNTPLVQPAPELKMNFYAMLNEYKTQQVQARPSLRERLKQFLLLQFQWQALSVGVLTVLILVIGYWGLSVFQQRFRQTEVAMTDFEFEKENNQNAVIEIPKPKHKETAPAKEEENAVGEREEDVLSEKKEMVIDSEKADRRGSEPLKEEATIISTTKDDTYLFTNLVQNGVVEVKNLQGNIHLQSYGGEGVKVESVPSYSFAGKIENNRVSIENTQTPQVDMKVFLPQNRALQLVVTAKQNITLDMDGVLLVSHNQLTSEQGNVEVLSDALPPISIQTNAQEVENDFALPAPITQNMPAFDKLEESKKDLASNFKRENENIHQNRVEGKQLKERDAKNAKKKTENKARAKTADVARDEDESPAGKTAEVIRKTTPNSIQSPSNKTLLINSPRGKAKIRKK